MITEADVSKYCLVKVHGVYGVDDEKETVRWENLGFRILSVVPDFAVIVTRPNDDIYLVNPNSVKIIDER